MGKISVYEGQSQQELIVRHDNREMIFNLPDHISKMQFIDDFNKWMGGELIQKALPYLNLDEREFLISGLTPQEWDNLFSE